MEQPSSHPYCYWFQQHACDTERNWDYIFSWFLCSGLLFEGWNLDRLGRDRSIIAWRVYPTGSSLSLTWLSLFSSKFIWLFSPFSFSLVLSFPLPLPYSLILSCLSYLLPSLSLHSLSPPWLFQPSPCSASSANSVLWWCYAMLLVHLKPESFFSLMTLSLGQFTLLHLFSLLVMTLLQRHSPSGPVSLSVLPAEIRKASFTFDPSMNTVLLTIKSSLCLSGIIWASQIGHTICLFTLLFTTFSVMLSF